VSNTREHGFFKWLLDLSTHAVWFGIEASPKYLGTVFSLLVLLRQWLLHAYGGLLFKLALCTLAVTLLYIGLRRLQKKRSNAVTKKPATKNTQIEPSDGSRVETTEKTRPLIYRPTLEEIKEYDPKLKKLSLKLGRATGLVIVAIFAALILAHPGEALGDYPPSHVSACGLNPNVCAGAVLPSPWPFLLLSLTFIVEVVAVLVVLVAGTVAFIRRRRIAPAPE
jgi:hypothetical protein